MIYMNWEDLEEGDIIKINPKFIKKCQHHWIKDLKGIGNLEVIGFEKSKEDERKGYVNIIYKSLKNTDTNTIGIKIKDGSFWSAGDEIPIPVFLIVGVKK